jgi:chorismate dehydratase
MLKLGVVAFLNSRPLIEGLADESDVQCLFDVPARLPRRLESADVDAALIPVIDVLKSSGRLRVVSDACIACDGETMTVRVFSQVPPDRVRRLAVDPDSHTSVALARVLWRELYGRELELHSAELRGPAASNFESVLLIGDKVVDQARGSFAYEIDLGGAWRQHTGLPFVFAVWAYSTGGTPAPHAVASAPRGRRIEQTVPSARLKQTVLSAPRGRRELGELLSAARDRGVARAAEIAETDGPALGWPVELARRYLTRCLRFSLDERAVAGAELFADYCRKLDLAPADARIRWPAAVVPA